MAKISVCFKAFQIMYRWNEIATLHPKCFWSDGAGVEIRTELGIFEAGTTDVRQWTMFFMCSGLLNSGPMISLNI